MKTIFRILFAVCMSAILPLNIQGKVVEPQTAIVVAHRYYTSVLQQQTSMQPEIVYQSSFDKEKLEGGQLIREAQTAFYVVAFGDEGFVIVSADDCVEPILGFSTESAFVAENIPAHVAFFLNEYTAEIKAIVESGVTDDVINAKWEKLLNATAAPKTGAIVVGPLLTTKWVQYYPYNSKCPADANATSAGGHALVGCGAIVMGQVMRYWRYPTTGTGSHSYSCGSYGTLSANFGNTTYDYDLMTNTISSVSAQVKIDAISTLLYHCGVSVNMNYGPTASWSNSNNIVSAMSTYFGYPATIQYKERSYYNDTQWLDMVKGELDDHAPFFYGGNGSYGGHVFVCDGYRDDDYFHINWGLGSSYDGYYVLSHLNAGQYDFSSNQAIIIGIRGPQLPESVTDNSGDTFKVYPNPVQNTLCVDASHVGAELSVSIYDLAGKMVYTEQLQASDGLLHHTINTGHLAKGVYLVSLESREGRQVQKIVVE